MICLIIKKKWWILKFIYWRYSFYFPWTYIYISTFARILYLKPLKEMYNSQSANFHHLLSIFKFLNINWFSWLLRQPILVYMKNMIHMVSLYITSCSGWLACGFQLLLLIMSMLLKVNIAITIHLFCFTFYRLLFSSSDLHIVWYAF